MTSIYTTTASPVGELLLVGDGQTLQGLYMQEGRKPKRVESSWSRDDDAFADVLGQLAAYFDGGPAIRDPRTAGERAVFRWLAATQGRAGRRRVRLMQRALRLAGW